MIRPATETDWPHVWPFWLRIVADGETYAYPDDLTSDEAYQLWMVDEIGPNRGAVAG